MRLTPQTLIQGIATVALVGLAVLSCDNRITDTDLGAPPRPSMSHVTVPPPAGSYDLPDPTTSGGDGSAVSERETGITIPEGDHYVRVRVTGGIVITTTDPDAPINGYIVGPWGLTPHTPFQYCDVDSCALSVVPRFYNSPTTSTGFFLNDVGNYLGERVALLTGPGWFTVERMGLSCAGDEGPCLFFSGHQTLSVDFVALALHASDTTPAAGEVVHFDAEGVNVTLGTPVYWQWWPAGADDFTSLDACDDHLECDFAPPSDGVMVAQSWVGDGMGSGFVAGEVKIKRATEAAAVTIIKAKGPNPGGSFTTVFGENKLTLEAAVTPSEDAGNTRWEILDDPEDHVQTSPPTRIDPEFGAMAEADVPPQDGNRWSTVTHTDRLDRKSLSLRVTAVVQTLQGPVRSAPVKVTQDEIDTMREEYQELGKLKLPDRDVIRASAASNTGDYTVVVVNTDFDTRLDSLRRAWLPTGLGWSISSYFRNPVHNDYHITPPGDTESKHQYGCAADIRTTHLSDPPTKSELKEANAFWDQLNKLARRKRFTVETREEQGGLPNHVHVQLSCR